MIGHFSLARCWACIALFKNKCNSVQGAGVLETSLGPSWTWTLERGCWIGIDSPQLYKCNTYSHFVPCIETFKSRLYMQTLLGTWHSLKHHSIMRHHQVLLKSFSQLPYFYLPSKGLLRAVSGKYVIPLIGDGRTHLCGERKGRSLEYVYQIFKVGSYFPGDKTISSSLPNSDFINTSSRTSLASLNRTFEIAALGIVTGFFPHKFCILLCLKPPPLQRYNFLLKCV